MWTKEFAISAPPGVPRGVLAESPCDETFDYARDGVLYGTFLLNGNGEEGASCSDSDSGTNSSSASTFGEVYTGATADPASGEAWQWRMVNGKAQPTNRHPPDQPWLVINKDPDHPRRDNVYVAYQPSLMQVAVAEANLPPDFTLDVSAGPATSFGGIRGIVSEPTIDQAPFTAFGKPPPPSIVLPAVRR